MSFHVKKVKGKKESKRNSGKVGLGFLGKKVLTLFDFCGPNIYTLKQEILDLLPSFIFFISYFYFYFYLGNYFIFSGVRDI